MDDCIPAPETQDGEWCAQPEPTYADPAVPWPLPPPSSVLFASFEGADGDDDLVVKFVDDVEVWRISHPNALRAVAHGDGVVFVPSPDGVSGDVTKVDGSGNLAWSWAVPSGPNLSQWVSVASQGADVVVHDRLAPEAVYVLDGETGALKHTWTWEDWETTDDFVGKGVAMSADSTVAYVLQIESVTAEGGLVHWRVTGIDLATGAQLWQKRILDVGSTFYRPNNLYFFRNVPGSDAAGFSIYKDGGGVVGLLEFPNGPTQEPVVAWTKEWNEGGPNSFDPNDMVCSTDAVYAVGPYLSGSDEILRRYSLAGDEVWLQRTGEGDFTWHYSLGVSMGHLITGALNSSGDSLFRLFDTATGEQLTEGSFPFGGLDFVGATAGLAEGDG